MSPLLVQLALVALFVLAFAGGITLERRFVWGSSESSPARSRSGPDPLEGLYEATEDPPERLVACSHCGEHNDPRYTYCRSCVEKI